MPRRLLGDRRRDLRRQQLAFRRLELTFRPLAAREIARASSVMIDRFAASGNVRMDDLHPPNIERLLRQTYAQSVAAIGGDVIGQGKSAGQISERKDFAEHFARMAQEFFIAWGARKVVEISDTTRNIISRAVARGHEQGMTQRALADYIRGIVPLTYNSRAEVIARTETHSAAMYGSLEAAKETGLRLDKEWSSAGDERTREDHEALDATAVPIDGEFDLGGFMCSYPGDPALPAEHSINCRCVLGYIVRD